MKLNYAYVDPGGNPTILVLDKIPREKQPAISEKIIKTSKLPCEQVGFLETPKNKRAALRLQMMGGEFCGNALRATAAILSVESKENKLILESSGTSKLIKTSVMKDDESIWAETEVPLSNPKVTKLDYLNMIRIDLEGVTHFLLPKKYFSKREEILETLKSWNITADAYGLIFYEQKEDKSFSIVPIVRVRRTDTLIYETSCASGSVALAIAMNDDLTVEQPSGSLLEVVILGETALIGGLIASIKLDQMNI